ncbi:MAG: phosphodiester glycosidase family protein [Clostridia bacterium]|nr:phosphodiester glycosidase family protein [Clostridia bacterium]
MTEMKLPVRILIALLCAVVILAMPFVLSGPNLLDHTKQQLMNEDSEDEEGEEIDFGRLFFSTAYAEEDDLDVVSVNEGELVSQPDWALPQDDFTVPPMPNPAGYTENGYADETIQVMVESREIDGMTVHIANVKISDPSQLRTAIAGKKVSSDKTAAVAAMAKANNTVIAMNGDYYGQLPEKKLFEFRMGQKIRSKTNKIKDTLIIDKDGDFHLFVKSKGLADFAKQNKDEIVNAFMFGPALVIDGEIQKIDSEYAYAPVYKNPRSAIGQTGKLSYVMVLVEGPEDNSGATQQEMAQIMYDLGCVQAYNLDGGNTAEMVMLEGYAEGNITEKFHFKGRTEAGTRGQTDIIYFATLVPENTWQ